ncbi:unnamed protein product [Paramecium primaurelia]|uniref:Transmembrane protein n=1 Tax=Paramecium primaurelia TaxID=5886 RepID=A0A8S1MZE2_PARPR|nr:unnamed protein product [Paramecium primaurelia]
MLDIRRLFCFGLSLFFISFKFLLNIAFQQFYNVIGKWRQMSGTQHQLALILGTNYSNTLFQQLQNSRQNVKQNKFQSHKLRDQLFNKQHFYVVQCPFLTLSESIDQREKCIKEYQEFFKREDLLRSQIKCLYIAIEYERNDLMKANLLNCIKWFNQYRDLIIIVVTSFEKADDQIQSKEELQKALSIYLQNDKQRLILVSKNSDSNNLNKQFLNAAQYASRNGQFIPKNTIFETIDQEESSRIMQQLHLTISGSNR